MDILYLYLPNHGFKKTQQYILGMSVMSLVSLAVVCMISLVYLDNPLCLRCAKSEILY